MLKGPVQMQRWVQSNKIHIVCALLFSLCSLQYLFIRNQGPHLLDLIKKIQILTFIRQISGLQELGSECAVRVLMSLLMAGLSVLPVAGPECSFIGGARRDSPPSAPEEQHRQLREAPQQNHG